MRILFVINSMARGGAEIQVRDLSLSLARRGHSVAVAVLLPFEDFEAQLRSGGVETFSVGLARGAASTPGLLRLLAFCRRFRPDVVHGHMFAANFAARVTGALLAPLLGKRPAVVCTAHTGVEAPERYIAYRATHGWCDVFTFVSSEALRVHEAGHALPRGVGRVVPNGIDLTAYRPTGDLLRAEARRQLGLEHSGFYWLAVGSFLYEAKDYSNLLVAFANVVTDGLDGQLLLAGEGRLLPAKQAEAARLGLASRVRFLGLRHDVDRLMRAADAYVMSSAWEGLPMVLLEAAATALPIVATDVGAIRDVVRDGAGILVPPKDPGALSRAMRSLMGLSKQERAALGQRARERAESRFDLSRVVDRWEEIYGTAADV